MRYKFLPLLAVCIFSFLPCLTVVAQPKAECPEISHNFGAFNEENGPVTYRFPIVNAGTEPLSILRARATCGCTTPEFSQKPIAPGDTSYISVSYDPKGRPGRFTKPIYVDADGEIPKFRLEITGVVIGSEATISQRYPVDFGPLKMVRPIFALGDVKMGRLKTVYLEGYNRNPDSLRVQVKDVPPYLDVVVAPKVAGPGEQVTLIAYINADKGAQYGVVEDSITVVPVPGLSYKLPIVMNVIEDFSKNDPASLERAPIAVPSTERLELGFIDKKKGRIRTLLKLENAGKNDLQIRRVYSVDPGIDVKASTTTVRKGKSADIIIDIDPSVQEGDILNSRIQIITNDPLHPSYTVRIVGEF